MQFYFEAADNFGREEHGVLEAADEAAAEDIISRCNMSVMEIRPATAEESASADLAARGKAVVALEPVGGSLLPLSQGKCWYQKDGKSLVGQLNFVLTGGVQHVLFSNLAETIDEVTERHWEALITDLRSVEKKGLISKRLVITTKAGDSAVFSGDIGRAFLLIQFSLAEHR